MDVQHTRLYCGRVVFDCNLDHVVDQMFYLVLILCEEHYINLINQHTNVTTLHSLTVSYKCTFSDSLSPNQPSSSLQLTSHDPTQKKKNYHPVTVLWLWWLKHVWTYQIKLLDEFTGHGGV